MSGSRFLFMAGASVVTFAIAAYGGVSAFAQETFDGLNAQSVQDAPAQDVLSAPEPAETTGDATDVGADAEAEAVDNVSPEQRMADIKAKFSPQDTGVDPDNIDSVLFTFWEQSAIDGAKRSALQNANVRGVTDDEILAAINRDDQAAKPKPPPEERDISLGGIVYEGKDNWVIWLNGERVEPNAIPEEIIGLKVYKNFIEVKWLDDYTMQVFPIRLRAHQRFNMDARIFLPG